MKPATEILWAAACVLTPKENWSRRMLARDEKGRKADLDVACRFCMVGAVHAVFVFVPGYSLFDRALAFEYLISARPEIGKDAGRFNDTHAHAEVLDALYRAAEISESS